MTVVDGRLVLVIGGVMTVAVVAVVVIVAGRANQVAVVEVQPPGLGVMIPGFVDVRRGGHDAERQDQGTTAQREDLTHAPNIYAVRQQAKSATGRD